MECIIKNQDSCICKHRPCTEFKKMFPNFSDDTLDEIFHGVIAEMNKRKAKRQNVDVGFWDSDGNYKEDIQEINETDEWANSKNDKTTSCSELLSEIGLYTISKENGKTTKFY